MLATLALAGLTASLSLAPEAASVAPAAPAGEGFRESGGYLHASPAGAAWYFGAPVIAYSWSLGGGYHFARGRRFAAQVGGFFQHIVWTPPDVMHDVRVGPELRIGGSSPRVFGYAVARVGLDIRTGAGNSSSQVYPGALVTLGAGVQGALGPRRRFILGFEPTASISLPGFMTVEARLLLGWRF